MMRKKRRRQPSLLLSLALLFGALAALSIGILAFWQMNQGDDALAIRQAELEAASLEASFQNLPEETPAPGALKIPILIYHSVRPIDPNDSQQTHDYEASPQIFEKQLKYLKDNGYTAVSLDQVASFLKASSTAPIAKPVAITFDDGWENQYKYAFPLLKKYGMTATFYVYTSPIGHRKAWLTWDQLKEMSAAGMDIEDHSFTHPLFRGLSLTQATEEITLSKEELEQHLGKPIRHFASPYGYSSSELRALVKANGYETYRTTYKGIYQDDPLRLRGLLITEDYSYFVKELSQ